MLALTWRSSAPVRARCTADDDLRINQAVESALQSCEHRALADVECVVGNGVVVLTGTVPTYYLKQLAQAIVLRQVNVRAVENGVHVEWR